jgi:hypothetical protein
VNDGLSTVQVAADLPVLPPLSPWAKRDWQPQPWLQAGDWHTVIGAARGTNKPASSRRPSDGWTLGDDRWQVEHVVVGRPPWLVLAVADGAGSAAFGGEGAALAVQVATATAVTCLRQRQQRRLRANLTRRDAHGIVAAVQTALDELAATLLCGRRELASTLLLAVAGPRATFALQIGDGAIVARTQSGEVLLATWPQQGEYVNTTSFVGDDDAKPALVSWPAVSELALLSDGLQHLALVSATKQPHLPFFAPLWQTMAQMPPAELQPLLCQWLQSPVITERTDDDTTLLLARRTERPVVAKPEVS